MPAYDASHFDPPASGTNNSSHPKQRRYAIWNAESLRR
jgi:hypothetical protein